LTVVIAKCLQGGFTILPDTLLFNAVYSRSDMHLTAQHPIYSVYI